MPLATILAATMTYSGLLPWWTQHIIAPFLLAFSINHLSEAPVFFRRCLALPWLRLLGIWSYSIYLWQQPFYLYQTDMPLA
jgi:peptidoglycan/LPS O-acetylase OafA/YrhL